jgi:hypothetical protein
LARMERSERLSIIADLPVIFVTTSDIAMMTFMFAEVGRGSVALNRTSTSARSNR